MTKEPHDIAVVGLGYVGLSLVTAFAECFSVIGLDTNPKRVDELRLGDDRNRQVPASALIKPKLTFSSNEADLEKADFIIIAVPTPVDEANEPDLTPLYSASKSVGKHLSSGSIVVYESTVYPGCTEEECLPLLERESGLVVDRDFGLGYSPERIDPGNPHHTLENIVKVVSARDAETLALMEHVYGAVVRAGLHSAPDIRTAEAAKVIENTQRDLNIALMNELSVLFGKLDLDMDSVLRAARTKWNFLNFYPGLVGGHCIPVDPYYLAHKARTVDFHPEMILASRRVNDMMGGYIAREAVKRLTAGGHKAAGCTALVLGLTYKENMPDFRNSRVFDVIGELRKLGLDVRVHDPLVKVPALEALTLDDPFHDQAAYDLVVVAVPHNEYMQRDVEDFTALCKTHGRGLFVDVRGMFNRTKVEASGTGYWTL